MCFKYRLLRFYRKRRVKVFDCFYTQQPENIGVVTEAQEEDEEDNVTVITEVESVISVIDGKNTETLTRPTSLDLL